MGVGDGDYFYFNWDQNSDSDFAKYELYRSTSANNLGTKIKTVTDIAYVYADDSISNGFIYYYTLLVVDIHGYSTESDPVILDRLPPNPSTLTGNFIDCTVEFSWTPNNNKDFYLYELYRSETENELGTSIFYTYDVGETSFTDYDQALCYYLSLGGTYYYTLVVYDYDYLSANSNVVIIKAQ